MDHAARGAAALACGDGLTAVNAYTQALIQHPTSPDYFVQRSTAFTRLKSPHGPRYDLALRDAEFAVLLGQKRAKREKIQAGQQRRVVALFGLGQYGNAGFVLNTMLKWRTSEKKDKMEGDIWKAKIEQKIKGLQEGDLVGMVTVKEYPDTELPSESGLKAILQDELKAGGTEEMENDEQGEKMTSEAAKAKAKANGNGNRTEIVGGEAAKSSNPIPESGIQVEHETIVSTSPAIPSARLTTATSKIRHDWIQNAQTVTVTLYAKSVPKDKAEIDIQEDSVFISFPHPSNPSTTFTFTLDPLFALINTATSTFSIMSTKVELSLRKTLPGQKWSALEGSEPLKSSTNDTDTSAKAAVVSTLNQPAIGDKSIATAPSYPTSSRKGPKDWDKLATDLTAKKKKEPTSKGKGKQKEKASSGGEDEEEDDGYDSDFGGGDPVDGFFKKLYAGADPDTRRAMMKSFQESNGTSLSTNWDEVGRGKVEPVQSKDD